jgi:serine/threonine-protein kinase RsbW
MTPTPETLRTSGDSGFEIRDLPATAAGTHRFRQQFTWWTNEALATGEQRRSDIVLAVYETVANATEHAYAHCAGGSVHVRAQYRHRTRTLNVTIADRGSWKHSHPSPHRGRGIKLINALCDTPTAATDPSGTTVSLQWRLFS